MLPMIIFIYSSTHSHSLTLALDSHLLDASSTPGIALGTKNVEMYLHASGAQEAYVLMMEVPSQE